MPQIPSDIPSDILRLPAVRGGATAADIEGLLRTEIAARFAGGRPPVRLDCDLPATLELPLPVESLRAMLAPLVRAAIEEAARPAVHAGGLVLREVSATAVDLGPCVEIEVACCGPAAAAGEIVIGIPAETRVAVGLAAGTLWCVRCPEGGTAVTIRLPRGVVRLAAA